MSVDQTTGRPRIGWRVLGSVPILGALVGLGFAFIGMQTTDMTLAVNPCASGFDNPFTRVAQVAFLAGIGGSLVIIVLSARTKNRDGVGSGIIAVVVGMVAMFLGLLMASAGYGWHCPNL